MTDYFDKLLINIIILRIVIVQLINENAMDTHIQFAIAVVVKVCN